MLDQLFNVQCLVINDQQADVADDNQNGLITVSSPYSVVETSDRLEQIIQEKGLILFPRIDLFSSFLSIGRHIL